MLIYIYYINNVILFDSTINGPFRLMFNIRADTLYTRLSSVHCQVGSLQGSNTPSYEACGLNIKLPPLKLHQTNHRISLYKVPVCFLTLTRLYWKKYPIETTFWGSLVTQVSSIVVKSQLSKTEISFFYMVLCCPAAIAFYKRSATH